MLRDGGPLHDGRAAKESARCVEVVNWTIIRLIGYLGAILVTSDRVIPFSVVLIAALEAGNAPVLLADSVQRQSAVRDVHGGTSLTCAAISQSGRPMTSCSHLRRKAHPLGSNALRGVCNAGMAAVRHPRRCHRAAAVADIAACGFGTGPSLSTGSMGAYDGGLCMISHWVAYAQAGFVITR